VQPAKWFSHFRAIAAVFGSAVVLSQHVRWARRGALHSLTGRLAMRLGND
jgi:hypothetical protein